MSPEALRDAAHQAEAFSAWLCYLTALGWFVLLLVVHFPAGPRR